MVVSFGEFSKNGYKIRLFPKNKPIQKKLICFRDFTFIPFQNILIFLKLFGVLAAPYGHNEIA